MKEFEGKVALVTGGGSGIGRATALAFAREGAQVVIGNRNVYRGEETVRMIRDAGGTASFRRTDVLVAADVEALVDHAIAAYGRLDVAFNNAGIDGDVRPLAEQTEANYDAVMDINVKGVWLSMKYEIPRMLEHGGGAICELLVGRRANRVPGTGNLHCLETRRHRTHENRCPRVFRARDSHQRGQPRSDRHGDGRPARRRHRYDQGGSGPAASHRAYRSGRRSGRRRSVAVFRQGVFCDGAQSDCRRRIHCPLTRPRLQSHLVIENGNHWTQADI